MFENVSMPTNREFKVGDTAELLLVGGDEVVGEVIAVGTKDTDVLLTLQTDGMERYFMYRQGQWTESIADAEQDLAA